MSTNPSTSSRRRMTSTASSRSTAFSMPSRMAKLLLYVLYYTKCRSSRPFADSRLVERTNRHCPEQLSSVQGPQQPFQQALRRWTGAGGGCERGCEAREAASTVQESRQPDSGLYLADYALRYPGPQVPKRPLDQGHCDAGQG